MNTDLILAEIITIGDEILYGQITDTNSQWLGEELSKAGIKTIRKTSVGDSEEEILNILSEAESRSNIILITGGLGPTNDDITKTTLCKFFKSELKLHHDALSDVTDFFKSRGRELTEINRLQAFLPENCKYIQNKWGTAPAMWFELNGKVLISMPGVPFEMKSLMTHTILPLLKEKFNPPFIYHKVIKTVGIGESFLADKIKTWEDQLSGKLKLAYLPSPGEVKLRLTGIGGNFDTLSNITDKEIKKLNSIIPEHIYGFDEETLPFVIGKLLLQRNLTLSIAESCTGGMVSQQITNIPGSSEYFKGSVVAYDNQVKSNILGVKVDTLESFGAVSEETVKEMAEGIRKTLQTEIGISTSGIAGPSGGSPEKPVGTIWIGYSDKEKTIAKKLSLGEDREINIRLTTVHVLNFLRQSLPQKS